MAKKPTPHVTDEESIPTIDMDDLMPNFTSRGAAEALKRARAQVVDEKPGSPAVTGRHGQRAKRKPITDADGEATPMSMDGFMFNPGCDLSDEFIREIRAARAHQHDVTGAPVVDGSDIPDSLSREGDVDDLSGR